MIDVTDATWDEEVLNSDKPVLVDFWAEWCGPCRKIHPLLEEIEASELGNTIKIVKLNTDENPKTAYTYNVMSIPLLILFDNAGNPVASLVGARPRKDILAMIESSL